MNELENHPFYSDSMAHYDACYGGDDMNPPSLLTMRNMVGISVINACRGALIYFNSITKLINREVYA